MREETKPFLEKFKNLQVNDFHSVDSIRAMNNISYYYSSTALADVLNDLVNSGLAIKKVKGINKYDEVVFYAGPSEYCKDGAHAGVWVYKLIASEENW